VIAALYVDPAGVYANLPDVEIWDEARDARLYDGPHPVVAHPPCARWSRLAGFTEARFGYKRGADGGCFVAALESVRTFGGVLEHPAYSKAWDVYHLPEPTWREGWTAGICGGFAAYVEQGRYGLPVKKATWLYAYGVEPSELRWGYTPDGDGEDSADMDSWRRRVTYAAANTTPPDFRDELLAIARTAPGGETLTGTPGAGGLRSESLAAGLLADQNERKKPITHGRHCSCSACAREDWTQPHLAPCGMHGPTCPPVYAPLAERNERSRREA
jgi:hypothetical protein